MTELTTGDREARIALGAGVDAKEVVVEGVRLAYADEGAGPPLLCLHAIGHGARDFSEVRARFRERCRVIALDWPGHGRSGEDPVPPSAARYGALVAGFADALALEDAVVIGNSVGGGAALHLAALRPARVRALVLANSAGLDRVGLDTRLATRAMAAFFAAGARGARWYPRAFAAYYRLVLRAAPAREQRARIVAAARASAPRLAEAWRSFGRADADLRAIAASLPCPVLVAWAEQDRVLSLSRNRPGIAAIPKHRLELFPAAHAAFLECPEAFARSLERFLDGLPPPRHPAA
jgi:4,5:9,10-diseco-3-hydroxy-5,9,17-trioxoandrosta-1(10),2-diene-4-oate hydrolase